MSTKLLHRSRQLLTLLLVCLLVSAPARAGITLTCADGTFRTADSVLIMSPNGVPLARVHGRRLVAPAGITPTGADGITLTGADGITLTGADGITLTGADGVLVTTPDGRT